MKLQFATLGLALESRGACLDHQLIITFTTLDSFILKSAWRLLLVRVETQAHVLSLQQYPQSASDHSITLPLRSPGTLV